MEREKKRSLLFVIPAFILLLLAIFQIILIFGSPLRQQDEEKETLTHSQKEASILTPGAIYITLGGEDKAFARLDAKEAAFLPLYEDCLSLLKKMLESDWFVEERASDLPYEEAALVMSYPIPMEGDLIRQELELSFGEEINYAFEEIWILPSLQEMQMPRVYLVDPAASFVLRLEVGERQWEENLAVYQAMLLEGTTRGREYLEAFRVFGIQIPGGFVRQPLVKETVVSGKIDPYFESLRLSEEENQARIASYGLSFFEYPDTVTVDSFENGVIYMNEKISLRIGKNGLVEYVETLTDLEKQRVGISEAYRIAQEFLEKDLSRQAGLKPQTAFAGYETSSGGYIFYFDYMLDEHPLQIDLSGTSLVHACKITVRGTKVQRSERLAVELLLESEVTPLNYSWLDMANQEDGIELTHVPTLFYREVNGTLIPRWLIKAKEGETQRIAF